LDGYATTTYLGGDQGWQDGPEPRFYEPGGLAISGDRLFVADTNNHVVRVTDLATGVTETLVIKGIDRFNPPPDAAEYRGTVIQLDPVVAAAGSGTLRLEIGLPEGYKVNEQAPSSVVWDAPGDVALLAPDADRSLTGVTFPVEIGVEFLSGEGVLLADLTVVYCRDDAESLCFIEQLRFHQPVTVADGGASSVTLPHVIPLPQV
ncbi:MAG: hypothetical protein ACE5GC_06570, partial [Acidimicrobiia bacterium]